MKKILSNKYTFFIYGLILLFVIWFIASLCFNTNHMIVPSPFAAVEEMVNCLSNNYTIICTLYSLGRTFVGFIIALLIAFLFASIGFKNEQLYNLFSPLMTFLRSFPTAAIVFLFIILVGSQSSPIIVVLFVCLPILYESFVSGFKNISDNLIDCSKTDGANSLVRFFTIRLPLSLPYILVGLISSFSLSFKIEIMAEVITGSTKNGLGCLIKYAQVSDPTNMTTVFAYSLIALLVMIIISLISIFTKSYLNKIIKTNLK